MATDRKGAIYSMLEQESKQIIDLLVRHIEGITRHEAAETIAASMKFSGVKEPTHTPIYLVAKEVAKLTKPTPFREVSRSVRKTLKGVIHDTTAISVLRRYNWKWITENVVRERRPKLSVPMMEPTRTMPTQTIEDHIPLEIQSEKVKSILMEVAGIKITISYGEQK